MRAQESEHKAHTNQNSRSTHDTQLHSTATADTHGMIEETIVTETRRTTEATMRMEHKTQLDIPITHTQNTQTPAVAVHSAGTTMTDGPPAPAPAAAATAATNTDRPPATVCGSTQTPPQPLPKPQSNGVAADTVIDTASISKHSSLQYFTKIIDQKDSVATASHVATNGDVYRRFDNVRPATNTTEDTVKLHAELAEMNLLPGPPPEMGFAPKPQKPKPEQLSDRIRKLEESHKEIADIPSGGVRMLPPAIVSPVFQKPAGQTSNGHREPETEHRTYVESNQLDSTTTLHESMHSQYKHENGFAAPSVPADKRAPSPRPSAHGVAMDRMWTSTKPPAPAPASAAEPPAQLFDSSCFHTSKNEFAEQKSVSVTRKPIGTPISESDTEPPMSHCESATSDGESMHPQRPQLRRRNSTKETAKMFENKIRDMDSAPHRHLYDLKAPGLVKQILPRAQSVTGPQSETPLPSAHRPSDIYLEPGTPPEICYAPRMPTASERKQSLVDAIEQTIEKDFVNGPTKILAGAVRMIPPAAIKKTPAQPNGLPKPVPAQQQPTETVQRLYDSKIYETKTASHVNGNGYQSGGVAPAVQPAATNGQPPVTRNGYAADAEDTLKRKSQSAQFTSTSTDSMKQSTSVFESYSSNYQKSYSGPNGAAPPTQPINHNHSVPYAQPTPQTSHKTPHVSHGHLDHLNGTSQKVRFACCVLCSVDVSFYPNLVSDLSFPNIYTLEICS